MHKLLDRQLRHHFGDVASCPASIRDLLEDISRTYEEAEQDRLQVERSLELMSKELMERNSQLRSKQREQQVIFDSVPAIIIYKDTQNRILRLNQKAAEALGGTVADLEGKRTEEVLPKEVAEALYRDDLIVITSGLPRLGIEESHPTPDGVLHWLRTDKVPFFDEDGKVMGVIVFSVDITQRKQAERRLRESEEQHRLIVETATEGIWMIDREGRTTFANSVLARLFGHTREDLLGRSVFSFMSEADQAKGRGIVAQLAEGNPVNLDMRFRRKDGSGLWMQCSAAPMRDAQGKVIGALGMMTDISKRRQAEQELKDAYHKLQAVDRERMQFLNSAAHELGTPLTPIRLQIHLLRSRMSQPGRDLNEVKAVDILDRNFERLGRLVRDLLDSARLQAESMKLHKAPVDLRDIIYSSVETYLAPSVEAGVMLEVGELPPLPVECDASRISQVLDNLLSNAVKFTPPGKKVRVEAVVRDGSARITVSDEGNGMKKEDLGRLFKPFTQVHDTMKVIKGGTGLGLYISQGLVNSHGGQIHAESDGLGKGSTFWFELPLRASAVATTENAVAA